MLTDGSLAGNLSPRGSSYNSIRVGSISSLTSSISLGFLFVFGGFSISSNSFSPGNLTVLVNLTGFLTSISVGL